MTTPPLPDLRFDVHTIFDDGGPHYTVIAYGDCDAMIAGLTVSEFAAFTNQLDAALDAGVDLAWVLDQWSAVRL